ncbi:MAG: hypothetical protein HRU15_16335 [Planctomycetes bacterium]|nr:hypothetical protein [Planctomycetota bacterium]
MKHTQVELPHSVDAILSEQKSDKDGVAYIAVSEDFYEIESQDIYNDVYDEYFNKYQSLIELFNSHFGETANVLAWDDDAHPEWAIGESVAVWQGQKMWLNINHEDRECPIIISLFRIDE